MIITQLVKASGPNWMRLRKHVVRCLKHDFTVMKNELILRVNAVFI